MEVYLVKFIKNSFLIILFLHIFQLNSAELNNFTKKRFYIVNLTSSFDIRIEVRESFARNTLSFKKLIHSKEYLDLEHQLGNIDGFRILFFKDNKFFTSLGMGALNSNENLAINHLETFRNTEIGTCNLIKIEVEENIDNKTINIKVINLINKKYLVKNDLPYEQLEGKDFTQKDISEKLVIL